jgi:hypothetical protein
MDARRDGTASGCGHWVARGDRIHQRPRGWVCQPCALAERTAVAVGTAVGTAVRGSL